jgi:hypothetical protein
MQLHAPAYIDMGAPRIRQAAAGKSRNGKTDIVGLSPPSHGHAATLDEWIVALEGRRRHLGLDYA